MITKMTLRQINAAFLILPLIIGFMTAEQAFGIDPGKTVTQYMMKFWDKKDGLPQNSANVVLQTRDGYLWIGTQEGLVRFDGVQFTLYDKKNTEAIRNNFISALAEDSAGVLWIGTWGGLTKFENGTFTFFGESQGLTNEPVRAILPEGSSLWIGTDGSGLFHFENGAFRNYLVSDGLSSNQILALCSGNDGSIWIGTDGGGLNRFDRKTFKHYSQKDGLTHLTVRSLLADSAGTLWIGTWGGGLNRLSGGKMTPVSEVSATALVAAVFKDRHGSLWIGTDAHGIYRLRDERTETLTVREGLPLNVIMSLCEDREGSLWIGTGGGGLGRVSDCSFSSFTTMNGLPHDMIWSVYEDPEGDVWFGTDGGGVTRMRDQNVITYSTRNGLSHNVVTAIYRDRTGAMWFGTRIAGLNRFTGGAFRSYPEIAGVSSNMIRCMIEDHVGNFWIGTQNGLVRTKNGRVTGVFNTSGGLPNNIVRTMIIGSDSALWIGTNGGFHRYRHGTFSTWNTDQGLGSNIVLCLYEDRDRTLWIGTYGGGLNRFRDGKITAITTSQGLYDDGVFSVLEDGRENLWMSSNNGVFRVSLKELHDLADGKISSVTCTAFGEAEGMASAECNTGYPPAMKARDGRLWFPTIRGAAVVDPNRIIENTYPPPVIIERMIVDGKAVSLSGGRELSLEPGATRYEFHYTGLSYLAPEKVRFQYMLEGFDPDWIDAGSRRIAYYTNIPYGHYTFRVRACNNSGIWNEEGAGLSFIQRPFVYQTAWFYIVCGMILTGLTAVAYGLRIRSLRRSQRELEDLVRVKTKLVESQKKDLQEALENLQNTQMQLVQSAKMSSLGQLVAGMAHEINNPITIINGYLPLLANYLDKFERFTAGVPAEPKIKSAIRDADEILKCCSASVDRIKKIIENLRSFSRLDEADYKLADVHENIESTLLLFLPNYQQHAEIQKRFAAIPPFYCFPGQLNQVFMNLLVNAAESVMERNRKEQREKGMIEIVTELDTAPEGIRIARVKIRDNGTGIPEKIREKIFDPFFTTKQIGSGTGLGLSVSYGIIQKHKGNFCVNPDITDGTEMVVEIPME